MHRSTISLSRQKRKGMSPGDLSIFLPDPGFGFQPSLQSKLRDTGGGRGGETEIHPEFVGSLQGSFLPRSACYLISQSPHIDAPHILSRVFIYSFIFVNSGTVNIQLIYSFRGTV